MQLAEGTPRYDSGLLGMEIERGQEIERGKEIEHSQGLNRPRRLSRCKATEQCKEVRPYIRAALARYPPNRSARPVSRGARPDIRCNRAESCGQIMASIGKSRVS
ncbi:hypothetical protein Dimus_027542 [Dionaea muscipula]